MISPARGSAAQRVISVDAESSAFVGRIAELDRVRNLLRDKRFVTVVGPSGIGKTRLLRRFALSQRVTSTYELVSCDLRDARDVDAMIAAIVLAAGGERVPSEDGARAAERVLRVRGDVLLVLDNVEPLLPLAAMVIQRLLGAAPNLRILAGSRTPIGLDDVVAESVVELSGLDEERGVELVSERLRAAGNHRVIGRATVASLVRKLGGVPLAIELATARFARDDGAVLARLAGLPERFDDDRSVQRAIDRAWTLLDEEERQLLGEASVFRGGLTLDQLVAVSELGVRSAEVALNLARRGLFEIVEPHPVRLVMAESVRAHAADIVESNGLTHAARMRHLRAFDAMPAIGADRENMRAAIAFASSEGLHDVALRLLLALDDTPNRDDLAALDLAIEHTRDVLLIARALGIRSNALHVQGKLAESKRDAEASLALAREVGDEGQVAAATRSVGLACFQLGEIDSARTCFERALTIERERGNRGAVAALLQSLGAVHASLGELETARIHHENALALAVEGEDPIAEARATIGLGSLWLEIGDLGRARTQYELGLAQARRLRMTRTERIVTGYLGILAFDAGRLQEAESRLRAASTACGDAGDLRVEGIFEGVRGAVLASLDRIAESRRAFARAEAALERNKFFAAVIAIHRGHLDLAEARKADEDRDHALGEANRVYARLRVYDAYEPKSDGEAPIVVRSDDARVAVRILERAVCAADPTAPV